MGVDRIPPDEAKKRLDSEEETVYLDVRSVEEFEAGHPLGAYNIPLLHKTTKGMVPNEDFLEVVRDTFSTDTPIICGCAVGGRSFRAASLLKERGYEDIVDMRAGYHGERDPYGSLVLEGWADRGYPVEEEAQAGRDYQTLKEKAG